MQTHIIGSDGYIGGKLLSRRGSGAAAHRYSPVPKAGEQLLELTKPDTLAFPLVQPGDFAVFLAAVSSPDVCEKQYDYAYSINVTGTFAAIQKLLERGANVLFFSSDVVVGPTKAPADETAPCRPFGAYARMKREIEEAFIGKAGFKVFRLSYVFSKDDKFSRYLRGCDEAKKPAEVFDALRRSVVYLEDILEAVERLGPRFGAFENPVFHLCGPRLLGRSDMAECYRQAVNPDFAYEIVQPPPGFFDARPNVIELASLYLPALLGRAPCDIRLAFEREYNSERTTNHG